MDILEKLKFDEKGLIPAVVQDFYTGQTFKAKRTTGSGHADCEPLTSSDTTKMNTIFGGQNWTSRPVLIIYNGRKLAAVGDDALGRGGKVNGQNLGGNRKNAKALCLRLHFEAEREAVYPFVKAGKVINLLSFGHLAACGKLFKHEGAKPRARGVKRGGVARRAAADNDNVVLRHGISPLTAQAPAPWAWRPRIWR